MQHRTPISLAAPSSQAQQSTLVERERVARMIVAQLNEWAIARPDLAGELTDCADEIGWAARLRPVEAVPRHQTAGLKHGAKQIITTLLLWAELYRDFSRYLSSCVGEIEIIAARHVSEGEKRARARDAVLEAVALGYRTSPQIAKFTKLRRQRVGRALVRLEQLGLVKDVGCGARSHADGYRTRLWELTRTDLIQRRAS